MPIFDAPLISKNPCFGFGAGDFFVSTGISEDDEAKERFLLIHLLPTGGPIGTVAETGRTDGLERISTEDRPADLVLHFSKEESVDQFLALLSRIKQSFRK